MLVYGGLAAALLLVLLIRRRGAAASTPATDPNATTTGATPGVASDPGMSGGGGSVDNGAQLASFESGLLDQLPQAITSGLAAGFANLPQQQQLGGAPSGDPGAAAAALAPTAPAALAPAAPPFALTIDMTSPGGAQTGPGGSPSRPGPAVKMMPHPVATANLAAEQRAAAAARANSQAEAARAAQEAAAARLAHERELLTQAEAAHRTMFSSGQSRAVLAHRYTAHPGWGPHTIANNGPLRGHSTRF